MFKEINKKTVREILYLICFICGIISVCLYALPFVKIGGYTMSGFELIDKGFENYKNDNFDNISGYLFIFASCLMCGGFSLSAIIAIIRATHDKPMISRKSLDRIEPEKAKRFAVRISVVSLLGSLIPIIINMNILSLTGLNENEFAKIAPSAIFSGLMMFIGGIFWTWAQYIELTENIKKSDSNRIIESE